MPKEQKDPLIEEIEHDAHLPPGVSAADALVAVVSPLSRRMTLGAARHLVEAFPEPEVPLLRPCLENRGKAPDIFDKYEYLMRVGKQLHTDDPERIVRAVCRAVRHTVAPAVIASVKSQLPRGLQQLWV
jgi:uncharacterized protein (DUF2267 family)